MAGQVSQWPRFSKLFNSCHTTDSQSHKKAILSECFITRGQSAYRTLLFYKPYHSIINFLLPEILLHFHMQSETIRKLSPFSQVRNSDFCRTYVNLSEAYHTCCAVSQNFFSYLQSIKCQHPISHVYRIFPLPFYIGSSWCFTSDFPPHHHQQAMAQNAPTKVSEADT